MKKDLANHPCFSELASQDYGRIHLAVAPKCNISCNYCNRKYDCANENHPGVTKEVLTPEQALNRLDLAVKEKPYINTVGIAGPGDSLANIEKTFKTLELIQEKYPDFNLCLSTNGLMLPDYADDLIELGVGYITVTVNTTDIDVAEKIYRRVVYNGKVYRDREGVEILLRRQQEGLAKLKGKDVFVKMNTLYIPTINEMEQIRDTADLAREMEVDLFNVMPLIPAPKSKFENLPKPDHALLNKVRKEVGVDLELMNHCRQCRSDAMGLLGERSCTSELGFNLNEKLIEAKVAK